MLATLFVALAAAMEVHLHGSVRSTQTFGIRGHGMRDERMSAFRRQPNYAYNGVATDPNENWCRHLATNLADGYGHHKTKRTSCVDDSLDEATCEASYQDGPHGRGHFELCMFENATASCKADSTEYNCTWTALMEDLMNEQTGDYHECLGELLEAKRSMDGLEHAGEELREDLEYQNRLIQIENGTIRQGLRNQQKEWAKYQDRQQECTDTYAEHTRVIRQLHAEIEELRAIADPRIRSAVNFVRDTGYQEKTTGTTETRRRRGEPESSLVQTDSTAIMDSTACTNMITVLNGLQKKAGVKETKELDCHQQREQLQEAFTQAYNSIIDEIKNTDSTAMENRSRCFSEATYRYKYEVEGPGKIDDTIEEAARKIHEAQLAIARLEPRLQDVEHAAGRMDRYIHHLNSTCEVDAGVSNDLKRIQNLIKTLQACPGRNDFVINVPHWNNPAATTPAPTPWHDAGRSAKITEYEALYPKNA